MFDTTMIPTEHCWQVTDLYAGLQRNH